MSDCKEKIINNWFDSITSNSLINYKGDITSDVITDFVSRSEKIFESDNTLDNFKKNTIHIFVECVQNLFHHALLISEKNIRFGAFSINYFDNCVTIVTGNYINSKMKQLISDRINQINSLSKEELKTLYRLILNNEEFSEKGGGGLGLIDVSKRTGTKLSYEFLNINENIYFYILKIKII